MDESYLYLDILFEVIYSCVKKEWKDLLKIDYLVYTESKLLNNYCIKEISSILDKYGEILLNRDEIIKKVNNLKNIKYSITSTDDIDVKIYQNFLEKLNRINGKEFIDVYKSYKNFINILGKKDEFVEKYTDVSKVYNNQREIIFTDLYYRKI